MLCNNMKMEMRHHARALGLLTNAGRTPSTASHTGHTAESSLQASGLSDTVWPKSKGHRVVNLCLTLLKTCWSVT